MRQSPNAHPRCVGCGKHSRSKSSSPMRHNHHDSHVSQLVCHVVHAVHIVHAVLPCMPCCACCACCACCVWCACCVYLSYSTLKTRMLHSMACGCITSTSIIHHESSGLQKSCTYTWTNRCRNMPRHKDHVNAYSPESCHQPSHSQVHEALCTCPAQLPLKKMCGHACAQIWLLHCQQHFGAQRKMDQDCPLIDQALTPSTGELT